MAYTVLARKYRSSTFSEVVGQGPIATTLVNAIQAGRLHHGYLFTGTRGVGKTSMARILAKALNCLERDTPSAEPCLTCDACVQIAAGTDIDVVEIDAASNTGVDNIRDLRSNAAYRPSRCRFKIYIIDEVHMLSTGAFNALLKTLEEPPEHVKFILATTELHKVPATIQSRCQRFNFRNIGPEMIAERLDSIVKSEGATADSVVLRRIARLAGGSMRDAVSLLDQLLAVSEQTLSSDVLDEVLPPTQSEQGFALLRALGDADVSAALQAADALLNAGHSPSQVCGELVEVARTLMLLRSCGNDTLLVDLPSTGREAYVLLAAKFDLSQYVQMIALLEELRRQTRGAGSGRALLDAAIVRLAHLKQWASIEQLLGADGAAASGTVEKKKLAPAAPDPPPMPQVDARAPLQHASAERSAQARRPDETSGTRAAPNRAAARRPLRDESSSREARPAPDAPRARTLPAGAVPVADQQRVREDPLVRDLLELMDGTIVDIRRDQRAAVPETSDPGTADAEIPDVGGDRASRGEAPDGTTQDEPTT